MGNKKVFLRNTNFLHIFQQERLKVSRLWYDSEASEIHGIGENVLLTHSLSLATAHIIINMHETLSF